MHTHGAATYTTGRPGARLNHTVRRGYPRLEYRLVTPPAEETVARNLSRAWSCDQQRIEPILRAIGLGADLRCETEVTAFDAGLGPQGLERTPGRGTDRLHLVNPPTSTQPTQPSPRRIRGGPREPKPFRSLSPGVSAADRISHDNRRGPGIERLPATEAIVSRSTGDQGSSPAPTAIRHIPHV